jgi:N-dimethylarginine dimethylaminohydrolase
MGKDYKKLSQMEVQRDEWKHLHERLQNKNLSIESHKPFQIRKLC